MGSQQSARASHFQRPIEEADPTEEPISDEHHISISNKMVERLVEDATLAGGAAAAQSLAPRGDYKDKMYMERLKCMDDSHSERTGLTVEDMKTLVNRIDYRTANMVSVEPVCAECQMKVIECYNQYEQPEENIKCWDSVKEFSACVQSAAAARLKARTAREAREHARLSRHMALARQHELRDLAAPAPREDSAAA